MSDSKLWEEAYQIYKGNRKQRKPRTRNKQQARPQTALQKEYANNRLEIMRLQKRQEQLKKEMDKRGINTMVRAEYYDQNIQLYVLKLENDNWYIGSSRNVERRFKKHLSGKGSKWTSQHIPIEIVEVIDTNTNHDVEACKKEDDLTLQYATKYCAQKVRGGGYSQVEVTPHWPREIIESEKICSHS